MFVCLLPESELESCITPEIRSLLLPGQEGHSWPGPPALLPNASGAHCKHGFKKRGWPVTCPSKGEGAQELGRMNWRTRTMWKEAFEWSRELGFKIPCLGKKHSSRHKSAKIVIALGVLHTDLACYIFQSPFTCIILFYPHNKLKRQTGKLFLFPFEDYKNDSESFYDFPRLLEKKTLLENC